MFQNTIVGVTSAFIRILYSILLGLLLLFRLDRVVLMKGFERFDKGHKSYIGFLYLEHTLNNSVLKLFAELLLEGRTKRRAEEARAVRDDKATPLGVAQLEDWIDMSARGIVGGRDGYCAGLANCLSMCYNYHKEEMVLHPIINL